MKKNLSILIAAFLIALPSCMKEYSFDEIPLGGDRITFATEGIQAEVATKVSETTISTLQSNGFNVSATTGSAGSEVSAWNNVAFSRSGSVYVGNKYWPASDPAYHFYASNLSLTHGASGCTVSATNSTDVVCAYLSSSTYKSQNTLSFQHIFARLCRVDVVAESGYTISGINVRITPKTGGTYNLRTGAGQTDGTGWSGVTTGSATQVASTTGANNNDIYLVPGIYTITCTWTSTQSGASVTHTNEVCNIQLVAGKTNNVSVVLGGDMMFGVDLQDYCEYDYRDNLDYLTFYCDEAGTIGWKCSNASIARTIQYSKDFGATWTDLTSTTSGATVSVSAGDIVWFKGSNTEYATSSYYNYFTLSNKAHVYGNVNSLTGNNTSVSQYCFYKLFENCSNLYTYEQKKIILPATTLASGCYALMFNGCTSLTVAPELPATTLANDCYGEMFEGCTSLTTAPELPATTLASYCYHNMFASCTSLNFIKALFITTPSSTYTSNWVSGVAPTGTFVRPVAATWNVTGDNGIPTGWTVKVETPGPGQWMNNPDKYLRFKFVTDGQVGWVNKKGDIQYSKNGGAWTAFNGATVSMSAGDEIWFKGNLTSGVGESAELDSSRFITSGKFYASGNVQSLCSFNNTLQSYHFGHLFDKNAGLNIHISTPLLLPATTLANYCYTNMFNGCTSLTVAPRLPATTLATSCYVSMFSNCTSLTSAPALPATTLKSSCYQNMFSNCTSLTTAPELPATTLMSQCYYNMFNACTSLTVAPRLPASTLANNCYQNMFYGCKSLTAAPELPATTLTSNCYNGMFNGCASLTTAPELPATTLATSCYNYMFSACASLTAAPELPATTLATSCYSYMFYACASLTTAPELPATTLAPSCYTNMFYGCVSLTTAPELPATTLNTNCYQYMFYGCASLTAAPELPATSLVSGCYANMFYNCTSLNYIKALFITTPSTSYTSNWVSKVASSGTFVKNSAATWSVTGVHGVPSGWTIETVTP